MNRIDRNQIYLNNIVFSDDVATLMVNGNVNRYNCHSWNNRNPHWKAEACTQRPQKVIVWARIWRIEYNQSFGPFFTVCNVNYHLYEVMLDNEIVRALKTSLGAQFQNWFFQQDGAPSHYVANVSQYLNMMFPQRWIGRHGAISWPALSPDLTPLHYFFWGCLKDHFYQTQGLQILTNWKIA